MTVKSHNAIPVAIFIEVTGVPMGTLYRKRNNGRPKGNWYANYKLADGSWLKRSTGTPVKKLAERRMKQWEAEELDPLGTVTILKFGDFVDDYKSWSGLVKKASTVTGERPVVARLDKFFGKDRMDRISAVTIQRYVAIRRKAGVRGRTINAELSVLSSILKQAVACRHLIHAPKIQRLSEGDSGVGVEVPDDIAAAVIENTEGEVRLMAALAFYTGQRRGSLVKLEWDHIDLERRQIIFPPSNMKQGKAHVVFICDELFELLEPMAGRGRLFTMHPATYSHKIGDALRELGQERGALHGFRHGFISSLARRGVDIRTISEMAGHSGIVVTARYTHTSEARMREAIKSRTVGAGTVIKGNFGKEG